MRVGKTKIGGKKMKVNNMTLGDHYVYTPSTTDVTIRWRANHGWVPPTEDPVYQKKWADFRINLTSGKWADFADANQRGHDIISYYAKCKNLNNGQAARELKEKYLGDKPRPQLNYPVVKKEKTALISQALLECQPLCPACAPSLGIVMSAPPVK